MGKKNRLKQLLGRFNKDTNCEIKALSYSFGGIVRDMFLKVELTGTETNLAIANVPYFIDEDSLKMLCLKALGTPVAEVQMTSSTALYGDPKKDYRSGHLVFATPQARLRAFDAISSTPFKLEELGIKLPAWHKPLSRRLGKRRHSESCEVKMEMSEANEQGEAKPDINRPDEDGWITVTKQHKFSFRGKINQLGEAGKGEPVGQAPSKKKRRR